MYVCKYLIECTYAGDSGSSSETCLGPNVCSEDEIVSTCHQSPVAISNQGTYTYMCSIMLTYYEQGAIIT